jgi:DNA helicase IV
MLKPSFTGRSYGYGWAAVSHPDLHAEQAYVDHAYACLDRMRELVARAGEAGATDVAAALLEAWSARRLQTFADAERGLCFGRLTLEHTTSPLYIGRRWVHDDDQDVVVVNWQAPAARPFYTATPDEPQRVTLRRRFRTSGRRVLDISDETLDGTGSGVIGGDFLLEELEQSRDVHMRDIVATIQSDQYRLIARDATPPLVVQGGPGTGKTAVGLHRASWLLYTFRSELERAGVLVVGPNPTFMDYVSHVLPALGEVSVEQRAVGELVDGIEVGRSDRPDVAALKADVRLAEVVRRAIELRVEAAPEDLYVRLEGSFITVREREVRELVESARDELGVGEAARERFRMNLLRRFYEQYGRVLGGLAVRDFGDVERALRKNGFLNRFLDRVWPAVSPDAVVRALLTSKARLAEAAEGTLAEQEQKLLLRDRPRRSADFTWTDGDLALLDEARAVLAAPPRRFGHVIVDEAQDLTPMQLRMVARRAAPGSLTVLGDIAQATGAVVYERWDELLPFLPGGAEAEVAELRHAYRVPREIMDLALPLLERIAPGVAPPLAYRTGAAPPRLRHVEAESLLAEAFHEAAALTRSEGLLAVIVPPLLLEAADAQLRELALDAHRSAFDEGAVPLLTPRQAKGLEFDHVVVVEPAAIVEAGGVQGLRELYVALTRPTRTLVVVHAQPLPEALSSAAPAASGRP